jgi:hypothetical protein
MTSRVVGRGPWTLVGDTKPAPADNPVELVHLTSEDAETAEEPEDAPANVVRSSAADDQPPTGLAAQAVTITNRSPQDR